MPGKEKGAGGGRAGFLNTHAAAAFAEAIRKEERVLHRLVEKQIELGRIVLPAQEEDGANSGGPLGLAATASSADTEAVDRQMAWLIAAHLGAGQGSPGEAAAGVARGEGQSQNHHHHHHQQQQQQPGQQARGHAQEPAETAARLAEPPTQHAAAGGRCSSASASPRGNAAKAERSASLTRAEEEVLLQQMRDISRSLWSTLSSGTASGSVAFPSSRTKADYAYSQEAVAAMWDSGELETTHHRRRDAHSKYVEASARDAAMRRGSPQPKAG